MSYRLLAHAEEFHNETTDVMDVMEHNLTEPVGFVVAVVAGIGLVFLMGRLFKWQRGTTILVLLGLLLAAGIFGYTYLPAIGALLIAIGITLALGFVLLGLINERDNL